METITINGIPYAAKDIEIIWFNRPVRGVTEINWSDDDEVEKTYVVGTKKAVAHTKGKNDCKGDITLLVNEVAGIEIAADGTINDLGDSDLIVLFKALPLPLKQTLRGAVSTGKAISVNAGSAQALAYKISLDILSISPLRPI